MQSTFGRVFLLGVLLLSSAGKAELAVPPEEATVLLNHLSIHSKNLTDEIAAINETVARRNGAPFVVHPRVLRQMAIMDPYVNGLVRTNLLAIPPRPRSPFWQPRPFEFMVSWRMADLFFGSERSQTALKNLVSAAESGANPAPARADFDQSMRQLINRYSIAVPATYIYIEALRRTFLINPCATWPNAELPAILARLEAQVFVLRQNLDALFINPFFNPCFPRSWGLLEATFHGFRMDVAAQGPLGIAPFPYFREGAQGPSFFQPQVQAVPRQGLNPVLNYDPNQFGNQWDRFSPGYVERNGVQPGAPVQSFPAAVGGQPGLPDVGGLPPQQGASVPNGQQGFDYGPNGQPLDQSGLNGQVLPNGQGQQQNPEVYGPPQQPMNQNYSGPQQPNYYGQQQPNYYGQQQPMNQNYYGPQQPMNQNYYGPQQPMNQNYYGQEQPLNQNTYGPQPLPNSNFGQQQPMNQNLNGAQPGYYGNQQGSVNGNPGFTYADGSSLPQAGPQNNSGGVNNGDGTLWGWADFGYTNNGQQQQQRQR